MIAMKVLFQNSTLLGTTTRNKKRNVKHKGSNSYKWKYIGQKGQPSAIKLHPL